MNATRKAIALMMAGALWSTALCREKGTLVSLSTADNAEDPTDPACCGAGWLRKLCQAIKARLEGISWVCSRLLAKCLS